MYVIGIKKQMIAILTEGPKVCSVIGGKKSPSLIQSLDLVLGTVTIEAEGVHVGTMYDLESGEFTWKDYDHLATAVNLFPSVSGGISGGGTPGTLIKRKIITDPAFCTAFRI